MPLLTYYAIKRIRGYPAGPFVTEWMRNPAVGGPWEGNFTAEFMSPDRGRVLENYLAIRDSEPHIRFLTLELNEQESLDNS